MLDTSSTLEFATQSVTAVMNQLPSDPQSWAKDILAPIMGDLLTKYAPAMAVVSVVFWAINRTSKGG